MNGGKKVNNAKIFTLILLPLLVMPTAAYVYAHVTDSVIKKYKLHVEESNVVIGSYKVVSRYDDDLIDKYPPDDELQQMGGTTSLSISTDNAFPGWWVWVGLLIKNDGFTTATVDMPTYEITTPSGIAVHHEEYFYGPYTQGDFVSVDHIVWGGVQWKDLEANGAPPGNVPPPVTLEPDGDANQNKMLLWIFIRLDDVDGPVDYFNVQLKIIVNVTTPSP